LKRPADDSLGDIALVLLMLGIAFRCPSRRQPNTRQVASLVVLLAAISTAGGCGRPANPGVEGGDGAADHHDAGTLDGSAPSCKYDAGTTGVDAGEVSSIFVGGGGPFNEPTNDGYVDSIRPTWRTDCFVVSSSGHLSGAVTAEFAGNAPTADDHRDALFWIAVGFYPNIDPMLPGEVVKPLSEIAGVVASSPGADSPSFALDGSFDLSVPADPGSKPLTAIGIGFTWVRVYRNDDALMYHVLPAGHPMQSPPISFDQPFNHTGSFLYYAPLADDPSLGSSFDYPAWIRAHATW
jgi:hypothetical protein